MSTGRVLVVGNGAREHAIAWKVAQSPLVVQVYVAPGNPGCATEPKVVCVDVDVAENEVVCVWCVENQIDLVVVGPEAPLANGLSDSLRSAGIRCFGPSRQAAQLESSKQFAKVFMTRYSIPTAQWKSFTKAEDAKQHINSRPEGSLVVKVSGLAAGKGVVVALTRNEACQAVDAAMKDKIFGDAGNVVVLEERLVGEEVSVLAFTDGKTVAIMPPAQDHKRLNDGDMGPNTGGMGAYCPYPALDKSTMDYIRKNVLEKVVEGIAKEGSPFVGVLYAGLMLTKNGPQVLEFNCRFGDPEAEVILPLLKSDLYLTMYACVEGKLSSALPVWDNSLNAVGVVMASSGYPGVPDKGQVISGVDKLVSRSTDTLVFQAATKKTQEEQLLLTNGGRVLVVVSIATTLREAARIALEGIDKIQFEKAQFRRDIGFKQFPQRAKNVTSSLTYEASGVNIKAGEYFVQLIRPLAERTRNTGVIGSLGSFGGLFDLGSYNLEEPVLVAGTDGVGTKLMVAKDYEKHLSIGIDLVAMCVNDVLVHGAQPLFFLDYFACGHLNVDQAREVVEGIVKGCSLANCSLLGGETAEMPGLYAEGNYDVAGFAVGVVEKGRLLPKTGIQAGDDIIGIASSGVHSNGFSLIRKIVERERLRYTDPAPFDSTRKLGEVLLTPTTIYVSSLLPSLQNGSVKAAAHITGGGITGNLQRVLPSTVGARIDASSWPVPPVFGWLSAAGNLTAEEMLNTFNCGLGMMLVVDSAKTEAVLRELDSAGQQAWRVGITEKDDTHSVNVLGFGGALTKSFSQPDEADHLAQTCKRVAVLISGSGTNLQALLDKFGNNKKRHACVTLVISNVPGVQGLERAHKACILTKVISHTDFGSRLEFDMAVDAALQKHQIDIVCLAGFMRILTGEFVRRWRGRLLNIHPSLLPSFKGLHPHKQALEVGVRVTGCTVHFVVEEVDAGGIVVQETVPVLPHDTEATLQDRVKTVEHRAYPHALELLARGQVKLDKEGCVRWKE